MNCKCFPHDPLDDDIIEWIEKDYPAEWDMERVFRKSYRKFLDAKRSAICPAAETGDIADGTVYVVNERKKLRIFTIGRAAAVFCAVLAVILIRGALKMTDRDVNIPGDIDKTPIVTDVKQTDPSEKGTSPVTAATTSAVTSAAETTSYAADIVISATEAADQRDDDDTIEDDTEQLSEGSMPTAPTDNIPTEISSDAVTAAATTAATTSYAETTTSPAATTSREDDQNGYFTVVDGKFTYIRNNDDAVEKREYDIDLDGFSVMRTYKDTYSEGYSFRDQLSEKGYSFQLVIFSYDHFMDGSDWEMYHLKQFTFFDINDKPACSAIEEGTAYLFWDNGYNICYCIGSEEHYKSMLELAEKLK